MESTNNLELYTKLAAFVKQIPSRALRLPTRLEVTIRAARALACYISDVNATKKGFAVALGVPYKTLELFLNDANPDRAKGSKHKIGPRSPKLRRILRYVPNDLRKLLLDCFDYDERIVCRSIRAKMRTKSNA